MANKKIFFLTHNDVEYSNNKKHREYIQAQIFQNYEDAEKANIFIIVDGDKGIKAVEKYIKKFSLYNR